MNSRLAQEPYNFENFGRQHRHTVKNFRCPFIITYFLLLNSSNGNEVCIPARPRTCLRTVLVRRLLQPDTPPFISPDMWPPNSPQLNPNLGSDAETRKNTGVRDTSDLKQRLSDTWTSVSQNIIHEVGDQWRKRLRACEKVKGHHICQTKPVTPFNSTKCLPMNAR